MSLPLHASDASEAAKLLSRYPPGSVPSDDTTAGQIQTMGQEGTREDIPLLRHLALHEADAVSEAALAAIGQIRVRQRERQREAWAQTLPNYADLQRAAAPFLALGVGEQEALCASYAHLVLTPRSEPAAGFVGDPGRFLGYGEPEKALSAGWQTVYEATAREDLGDVAGAVTALAHLAAGGHDDARLMLDGFGVDAERLLLGIFALQRVDGVLDVLVANGDTLTVVVLAEQAHGRSEKARMAALALGRMLDGFERDRPLDPQSERLARRTLVYVAEEEATP